MIKPIDEIPQTEAQKRKNYREQIRNDIQDAINNGVGQYEFVGEYNFKYLHQYAREEAERLWRKTFRNIVLPHYPEWKEKYQQEHIFLSEFDFRRYNNVKISAVKSDTPGEKRVFCEVLDLKEVEEKVLGACEQKLASRQKMDEKKKMLKMESNDETETFDFSEELT